MTEPKTSRPFQERFLDGFDRSQLRQEVQKVKPRKLSGQMPTSSRSFFVFCEARAASRPEVQAFCEWLVAEARGEATQPAPVPNGALPKSKRGRAGRKAAA